MDGRIHPFLLQPAIEMQLHVPRAFEFLKDQFVHAAAGFSQRRGQYGEAAAFFSISRGPEKFLRSSERLCFDPSGHDAAFARLKIIVSARKPRQTVKQEHHVVFHFHEAFGAFEHHLGNLYVALHAFVKV